MRHTSCESILKQPESRFQLLQKECFKKNALLRPVRRVSTASDQTPLLSIADRIHKCRLSEYSRFFYKNTEHRTQLQIYFPTQTRSYFCSQTLTILPSILSLSLSVYFFLHHFALFLNLLLFKCFLLSCPISLLCIEFIFFVYLYKLYVARGELEDKKL